MHILKRMHTMTYKPASLTYNALNLRPFTSGMQLRPAPGDHAIVSVGFRIQYQMQRAVDHPGTDPDTFATQTHTCTHPSVRPSVRLASVLAVRLGLPYIRAIRAFTCGVRCDCERLRAAIVPGSSFCSLWSLKQHRDFRSRQRKSTAGCLPTVLAIRYVRSLCVPTRLRPSVRPAYCSIHVSACSHDAKKRMRSAELKWFSTRIARASLSSTGEPNSISSGSKCHWSDSRSVMFKLLCSIALLPKCTPMTARLPRSKNMYLTALPLGTGIIRTAILPAHKRPIKLKNESVPGRDTTTFSLSAYVTGSGSLCL